MKPLEKFYKIRVATTHKMTEEGLRGLWKYHRPEPFNLKEALKLARQLLSNNPEVEVQIYEGMKMLERECD